MKVVETYLDDSFKKPSKDENLLFLLVCALCNNTKVVFEGIKKKIVGNQTEIALRNFAEELGVVKEIMEKEYIRIGEIPFTSERKMMSVICEKDEKIYVFTKGAPEILLEKCSKILKDGKICKLSEDEKRKILKANEKMASKALRVIGLAYKELATKPKSSKDIEKNLVWLGLAGIADLPRPEVKKAIEDCRNAGIRVIMLTGDSPITAKAIADEIGLETTEVIEGKQLDKMSNEELEEVLKRNVNVFARVTPFHKLRVLEILQRKYRVAMTGDGVNDAPALKKAHVGIAMGIRGTEVAKEASDMILLDDNFATIKEAVKEGRRIFDNIRKFVNYLFVCNLAEVLVIFFATLFFTLKKPILLPVQILWINLLTDGFPAIALGFDPARDDVMRRPPRPRNEGIINRQLAWIIAVIGSKKALDLLATFLFFTWLFGEEVGRTALFTGFILYEFIRIGVIRVQEKMSFFANRILVISLVVSLALQLTLLYTPLATIFHVVPLSLLHWLILLGFGAIGFATSILLTKLIMKYVV
jgi:Ca2+-transporting ATPase